MPSEQDSVWKEVLDAYFVEFLAFFFPQAHQDIDWERGYEFLDKELEKITQDSEIGKRLVDKLVKVYLKNGKETWVLIHVEVQGHEEEGFDERIHTYNYRILDRYKHKAVSFVILTDTNRKFRPKGYEFKLWDFTNICKFPTIKLIDYNKKWDALEANPNPFAVVVMAQLKALKVKKPNERFDWKLRLIRMLYERDYSRQQIINLFRFIDWLIRLPKDLEQDFREEVTKLEDAKMPYVTSIERLSKEEGRQEGLQEGVQTLTMRQLKHRFGELAPELEQQIKTLSVEQLEDLGEALLDFSGVEELKSWLQEKTPNA